MSATADYRVTAHCRNDRRRFVVCLGRTAAECHRQLSEALRLFPRAALWRIDRRSIRVERFILWKPAEPFGAWKGFYAVDLEEASLLIAQTKRPLRSSTERVVL